MRWKEWLFDVVCCLIICLMLERMIVFPANQGRNI